ncbi:uncharacterized protein LOC129586313 [Paramacrobiotus metropolitanus]|uniref:uncharacterized protein LOC129586313 n=1 Tax=Paramacrobiotus metropolitanus TaxID=2943436 RepID=UPI002445A2C1|nr:uncharacterized protein LOC129586313 [Paramacrobiotus metropolitanus]
MPLTVLNPRQAARLKQPLYEAVTKGNIDRIFSDMKVALSELRPSTNARKSLPRPTWTGLHVTVYGTEEVARKLLHAGFEFVLPGKMSSDPIERIFSAFKYGSGKVTVGKVKEEVARMETLQHLTGTTNVSRMGRQKRKNTGLTFSTSPLKKKRHIDRPLRTKVFSFEADIGYLRALGELSAHVPSDIFSGLQKIDPRLWSAATIADLVTADPYTIFSCRKDVVGTGLTDVGGYIVSKMQKGKFPCSSCKSGIGNLLGVCFSETGGLVEARSRVEFGGLSLPSPQLGKLLHYALGFFERLQKISEFYKGDSHLERALKLILLSMDLHGFHPLSDICVCESTKYLEYECLKRFFNTAFKNDVIERRADAVKKKYGARKSVPMSTDPGKLKKLKQL